MLLLFCNQVLKFTKYKKLIRKEFIFSLQTNLKNASLKLTYKVILSVLMSSVILSIPRLISSISFSEN